MRAPGDLALPSALSAAGILLASAGAALVIPVLPLRLGLPSLLLLAGVLLPARIVEESLRTFALASIWVWSAGGVLAAPPGTRRSAALGMLALGLALGLPAAASGLREARFLSRRLDAGFAAGSLLLAGLGLAAGLVWPQRIAVPLPALLTLLGISLLGYLALRAVPDGREAVVRRAAAAGLVLAACMLLAVLGQWRASSRSAARLEAGADLAPALAAAEREVTRARALDLQGPLADALRRRARLCGLSGDATARRESLREVALLDPADLATGQELFRLALADPYGSIELLQQFRRLPDPLVDAAAAAQLLPRALQAGDWEAFARAWRLAGDDPLLAGLGAGDLADAAEALYFRGEYRTAAQLLRRSPGEGRDWRMTRLLVHALLQDGRGGEARDALATADAAGHETEAAWLAARLADGAARDEGGGITAEDTLKLTSCRLEGSPAAPGGVVTLTFAWEALAPVPPDWRVFVHLRRDEYGGFFFQGDHEFQDVGHPARDLACGSGFGYTVRIPVPREAPPGDYSVTVGLWDGRANRRLTPAPPLPAELAIAQGDRVLLAPGLKLLPVR